jgi:hypothetical protein
MRVAVASPTLPVGGWNTTETAQVASGARVVQVLVATNSAALGPDTVTERIPVGASPWLPMVKVYCELVDRGAK